MRAAIVCLILVLGSGCNNSPTGVASGAEAKPQEERAAPGPDVQIHQDIETSPDTNTSAPQGKTISDPPQEADIVAPEDEDQDTSAKVEPAFDPTPYESPIDQKQTGDLQATGDKPHARQVVPFADGQDPFSTLAAPKPKVLDANDPRGDTLRIGPQIPPEKGEVQEAFPPKIELPAPPKVQTPDLKVVRHKPDEAVELVSAVTVTFNQPMVPLATLSELDQTKSPVVIEPRPEGRFVWMGTDTVAFEPTFRMPFATQYKVTVPSGATSALGKSLAEPYTFTFDTPRPKVVGSIPYHDAKEVELNDPVLITFNASVDPKVVLAHTKLYDGNRTVELALASDALQPPKESGNPIVDKQRAWEFSRTVALKATSPLKPGTNYRLVVASSVKCTEGPLDAGVDTTIGFRTYDPLVIKQISCSYRSKEPCWPGAPIVIEFNNTLKRTKVGELISISPAVENTSYRVYGSSVTIFGDFEPSMSYTVDAKPGFMDVHKQTSKSGFKDKVTYKEASPFLSLVRTGVAVVEAKEEPTYLMTSMNVNSVKVRTTPVTDDQIPLAAERSGQSWWDEKRKGDFLKEFSNIKSEDYETGKVRNKVVRNPLPLTPQLDSDGRGLVLIEAVGRVPDGFLRTREVRQVALVQVTDLGVTAAMSDNEIVVMVTRLSDASPVAEASVTLIDQKSRRLATATTDSQGIARIPSPRKAGASDYGPFFVVAKQAGDRCFLQVSGSGDGGYVSSFNYGTAMDGQSSIDGVVVSERGLYRPSEEVFLHAIVRMTEHGPKGDLRLLTESERHCSYQVTDPRSTEIAKGTLTLSPFGTASFSLVTAKDAPLGDYLVRLSCAAGPLHGSFQVEEYRTPEYKTEVKWNLDGTNLLVYRDVSATISANYYFGSPMAGGDVQWRLSRSSSGYTPPNNWDYTFSDISEQSDFNQTRYYDDYEYEGRHPRRHYGGSDGVIKSGEGKLGSDGTLTIPLKLDPGEIRKAPVSFTLEAEVFDKNRQSIASRATTLAHWAERYMGLAVDRFLVGEGETVEVSGVVTRFDGTRYDDADVAIRLMQITWTNTDDVNEQGDIQYISKYSEKEVANCTFKAGQVAGKCVIKVPKAGSYVIRGLTRDKAGREVRSAVRIYAYGDSGSYWNPSPDNRVELIPDKTEYNAGDKARILMQAPFQSGRALVFVSREGFVDVSSIEFKGGNATFEVPIEERFMPSISVNVAVVRGRIEKPGVTKDDRGRPAYGFGMKSLSVSRKAREISIKITPSSTGVAPGETLTLDLEATDAAGKPVEANVALMVVDEGVLSLISYSTPNPLVALYSGRASGTAVSDLRPLVVPRIKPRAQLEIDVGNAEMEEKAAGGVMMKSAEGAPPPRPTAARAQSAPGAKDKAKNDGDDEAAPAFALREFFKSTAYFNGQLKTDASGRISVQVKMPDNLTEFRVMAIAADSGVKFGSKDTQVRTRLPLMVRPALPRFLNFGDQFEAAVVVNNETGFDTDILVRCLASNASVESGIKTLSVPNGEAREIRFKAGSGQPGPATFQFAAVSLTEKRHTDASELTIPTLIPATGEAFATYGVVETAIAQPLSMPTDAIPNYGGLDVSLSSTAMTGLQDSVSYLIDYPYECTEQICSRILPIMALEDIIVDFRLGKATSREEARALVQQGIRDLLLHQRSDGGFGSWPDSEYSWMYLTAYALMTLDYAKSKGFTVDENAMEQAAQFLQNRLDNPYEWEAYAYETQVYSAYVLTKLGKAPKSHLDRLYRLADGDKGSNPKILPLYSRAWLMEALWRVDKNDARIQELYRQINNAAVEKASSIHFAEGVSEYSRLMMYSEDRTDAIILGVLLVTNPNDSMVDKVVRGLMRARVQGRWSTTQSNAYALLAMSHYYNLFEKDVPNFQSGLWLGNQPLMGHEFKGRSMDIVKTRVPMKSILESAAGDLILAKKGTGRLYYRLGLKYAPKSLKLAADDRGFMVERVYLPEDDKAGNVRRGPDGEYIIKAGSVVRVKVRVVAPDNRYYVAVVDPMPAGFEAVNENFATTARTRSGAETSDEWRTGRPYYWYYWDPWDFKEKRDDRVQLFMDRMYGGVYEYTYLARATTIGDFVVPPTRAEEMYEPETFGRSASEKVVVEP